MLKNWIFRFWLVLLVSVSGSSYGQTIRMRHYDTTCIRATCRKLVMRHADNGYPFASVVADSAVIAGRRRVNVYCSTMLSQRYRIGNVYMLGGAGVSPYYIYSAAGIAPGTIYNESRVSLSSRRLTALGTVKVLQPTEVEFHPDGAADVYMYLKNIRTNAASAGVALNRDINDGKYFVTGNILADLRNNFGHGERFYFEWNGYSRRSQMLDINAQWPYAFNTQVTPEARLNVTKTDTLCLTAQMKAGLGVSLSPDMEVKASVDVRRLVFTRDYDHYNDNDDNCSTALYGIGFNCHKAIGNDLHIKIECATSTGTRKTDNGKGSVTEFSSVVEGEIPLLSWARYEGRWTGMHTYFANAPDIYECSPIGGVGSLRGFAYNELRATSLLTFCNTLRVLLSEGFSVQAFYDQAFYKCNAFNVDASDSPFGFGVGAGVKTGAARLDIGWAIGVEHGRMRPLKDAKTLIIIRLDF